MKKILSLLTLLVLCAAGAWAQTNLIDRSNATPKINVTDFRTGLSAITTTGTNATIAFDGTELTGYLKFGSTNSSAKQSDFSKMIAYDVKSTATTIKFYVYSTNSNTQKLRMTEIVEGETYDSEPITEKDVSSKKAEVIEFTSNGEKNRTLYFYVGNTNIQIYQVEAIETGTALPTGGQPGYELNLNKGRAVLTSGKATQIDGIEFLVSSNYKPLDGTNATIKTKGTNYVKFTTTQTTKITVTVSSSNAFYIATTMGATEDGLTQYKATAEIEIAAGTWYIVPNGSNVNITKLAFARPACTSVAAPASLTCSAQTSTSLTFSWTAAENASKYTATLYSDAECTSEVATQSNIATTSVTFSTLSASTTYYCKVQSNGDGTTYCEEGNVTDAASGTTGAKAYTVTVNVNDADMGSAVADAGSLDEGETAEITATPNSGHKFVSWAVSGTGATLSSTTDNPTTLTIGSADATVTATFRALYTYTISYAAGTGDGITGSKADETKTEDEAFTLPSTAVFTRSGYVQTGWATSDGGSKAFELGGSYTTNADQAFYPFWTAANTLTFDANGGTGSMEAQQGVGTITLAANAYTKSGYTFMGWNTVADGSGISYADGASYSLGANSTLYAQWAENFVNLVPATSGDAPTEKDVVINMQSGSFGGAIYTAGAKDGKYSESFEYTASGFALKKGGADSLRVELNDYLQPGSIITLKFAAGGANDRDRGLNVYALSSPSKNAVTSPKFASGGTWENGTVGVFSYTVTGSDKLKGAKGFILARNNSVYLQSVTVANAQPGATTTSTGWCTYSSHKALDLSTLTDGFTAYVAKEVNGDNNVIMSSTNAIVPAETGLMIKGTASTKFTIDATSKEATFSGTNLLVALPEGGTVTAANNTSEWNYVFGYESATNYGFYKINAEAATLGLGKAYLHTTTALATAGSARLGIIFDDETTGITSTAMQPSTEQYFNLAGQRVAQPTKGLYIVNGRKVVVK